MHRLDLLNAAYFSVRFQMVKLWFEPQAKANYGLSDSGARGFGAIALDEKRKENRLIVQHNLSSFWKRDELMGEPITFPTPLVPPRSISAKWRLPEHFFYDQTEVQLVNRNLLAARQVQNGTVQMWTVSERSNQKTLELFTLNTKRDFVTLDPEQASTSSVLPAAARQLKTATDRMNGDLWIRTMASLYLKTQDDQFTQIFRGAISTFHENPFFEEVIICDGRDFVWIGQPGNSFTRVKNTFGTASKKLAPTSHPRILFSADEHSLRLLDVRNDSPQTAVPLYQLDDWQKITSLSSKNFLSQIDTAEEPQLLFNKPRILHVLPMQSSERFCMLVTTKHLILVDSRIPGQPILTFGHGIEGLIHHIETCPPWRDPVEGGFVHNFYFLSHVPSRFSLVSLYQHHNGLWSTLQPPKACRVPGDFLHLVRADISGESFEHLFSPTRSIATVSEYDESDSCIILTALDDGSLWSQRQTHQKTSAKETEKKFSASVKLVKKYVRSSRHQRDPSFTDLPDEVCPSRKDLLMTVPVDQVTSKKKFRKPKQHYDLDQIIQTMDRTNLDSSAEKEEKEVRLRETIALIEKETNERRINTRMTLDILQGEPIASISHLLSWEEFDAQGLLQSNTTTTRFALLDIQEENEDEEMMNELCCPPDACGFKGSGGDTQPINGYDRANLAQTYSALLSLLILDDDISRVDQKAILEAIRLSQRENGCFWSQGIGSESDMRFVFCAVAVCHIFNDFSPINWKTLRSFIRSSMTYDGGIGQGENAEAHGGSTFCAIAALSLSGRLWDESILTQGELTRLIKWAILKQEIGFHGRTGKPDDTCYAFWIGATLKILNAYHLCSSSSVRQFLLSTQHNHMGGFSKLCEDGAYPDMLHTYFSLAALSLQGEPTLRSLHPALNISERVYGKLRGINQVNSLVL